AMFGVFAGRAYYLLSGSSSGGRKNAGPPHLLWTMIERLKDSGVIILNLGGAAAPTRDDDPAWALYRFKRDFAPAIISQPSGTKTTSPVGAALHRVLLTLKDALTSWRESFKATVPRLKPPPALFHGAAVAPHRAY